MLSKSLFLNLLLQLLAGCNCVNDLGHQLHDSSCGDWMAYKNEHCLKLVSRSGFQTKEDAEIVCNGFADEFPSQDRPRLLTIKSIEKQMFLQNFIFKELETFDNVWLGLNMGNDNVFRWNDGTEAFFTNWAESNITSDHERQCVQMESGEGFYETGKWVRVNCKKKNIVVCERTQMWTIALLENVVMSLKSEVEKNKQETEEMIIEVKKQTQQQIIDVKREAEEELNQKVNQMKKEAEEKLNEKINEMKKEAEETLNQKVTEVKKEAELNISLTNREISILKLNPIPIGFVFAQLPGQVPPTILWPQVSWKDVSQDYAGLFFRVQGGNSAPFGQEQQGNTHDLWRVENAPKYDTHSIDPLPSDGKWSLYLYTGGDSGGHVGIRFQATAGEVRPRNKAVRIWQRLG